jgi:Serine incorporator (Serinc)
MFGDTAGPSKGAAMQDYEPVSYNYSWFHFIFSLASMYIAMLMTGVTLPSTGVMWYVVTWLECTSPSLAL